MRSAQGGIQSKDEKSRCSFLRVLILTPFSRLPFFFKPVHKNSFADELIFDYTISASGNGGFANVDQGLDSKITFKASDSRQYDGHKLYFYHGDEIGKDGNKPVNSILRWNVVMKCLAQGIDIHGVVVHTLKQLQIQLVMVVGTLCNSVK